MHYAKEHINNHVLQDFLVHVQAQEELLSPAIECVGVVKDALKNNFV
jgi:hypothetical protein